jgi:uncharacterized protein
MARILTAVGLGPGGLSATPQQLQMAVPCAVPAMLAGPGIASLLLIGVPYGPVGVRELRTRLLTWRVGARWYAIALLTTLTTVLRVLSLISPMARRHVPRATYGLQNPHGVGLRAY